MSKPTSYLISRVRDYLKNGHSIDYIKEMLKFTFAKTDVDPDQFIMYIAFNVQFKSSSHVIGTKREPYSTDEMDYGTPDLSHITFESLTETEKTYYKLKNKEHEQSSITNNSGTLQ